MEIHEQTATFQAFLTMSKWGSLVIAVGLLFATVQFCTEAGFGAALVSAVVVAAIGWFALKSKKSASH
jgi:hypothetical protein